MTSAAKNLRLAAKTRRLSLQRTADAHRGVREAALAAVAAGMGPTEAAELAGVSRQTIHEWLREDGRS